MKKFKFRFLFVVALMFQMMVVPYHFSADELDTSSPTWAAPIDYLAIGDSLAAGVTPNKELGKGYADYLAELLHSNGVLKSFNKGFSAPGYKTTDVLNDIQKNVTKDIYGVGYAEKTAQLQQSIKDAELITISVGANDIIPLLQKDPATGMASVDQHALLQALQQVGINYKMLMAQINQLNPKAQVYVMGYYNSFPYMPAVMQPELKKMQDALNQAIATGIVGTQAVLVATGDQIAADYKTYLPNPEDIHLSEAGYKKVTEQFWSSMEKTYPWVSANALSATAIEGNSVNLNWQAAVDNVGIVSYELFNGKEKLATVNGDATSFKVEKLAEGTAYTFSVIAIDKAGNKSIFNPTTTVKTKGSAGTPTPKPTPALFSDIAGTNLKAYIEQAAAAGIVSGYKDGTFKPNENLTRSQAASIIVRALGMKTDQAAPFGDIANFSNQTKAEINAAYKYGIILGSGGNFRPNAAVTRVELAMMLERSYVFATESSYKASGHPPFSDIGNYSAGTINAIAMVYELKIASGSAGKFMPNNPTTRGQAAKMFVNFMALSQAN
ncbi:S-layer homology domain-containing protein [Sporosarcina beigongshangi]|uniref:S-layer homology domain-containing protein n=1 Tax=Sporosarcina beigongshangi TaxID=2782538 RepID=UPI00193AB59A|nr:S-layer homology domain-containing protein [Sporosarcina beigongshangi]